MTTSNGTKWSLLFLSSIASLLPYIGYSGAGRGDYRVLYHGQSIDDLIIEYMEENNIPGMSLAIVQAPYITRIVGYGLADIDKKTLVASHTVFPLGQITNAYTAVAIMQLKEENKLALNDPITKYLTDAPDTWKNITINDLLTHSSGLPSYTEDSSFDYAKNYSSTDIINLIKGKNLKFEPGARVENSATDNFLLGLIVEKASGTSYQDYVTKNQIQRAGLKHTFFLSNTNTITNEMNNQTTPFKHSQFLQNPIFINPTELAMGYDEQNGQLHSSKPNSWSALFANAGVAASAEDVSLWDIALAGNILLKDAKDREFLYQSVSLKNNFTSPGNAGWFFPGRKGLMEIKGNIPGYSTFLSRFTAPTELLCVTLLANKEGLPDLDILARKIAGAFDEKLAAPKGSPWSDTIQSPYSVNETINRVAENIKAQGGKIFARIDQSQEATAAGQSLQATEILLVGNPAKGTALMQANPAIALDLPLRIMATDKDGQVYLSFTDPVALAKVYDMPADQRTLLKQMSRGIREACEKAVSPNAAKQ